MYLCNGDSIGDCDVGEVWMEPRSKGGVVVLVCLKKNSFGLEQNIFLWHQNKREQFEFEDAAAGDWRR